MSRSQTSTSTAQAHARARRTGPSTASGIPSDRARPLRARLTEDTFPWKGALGLRVRPVLVVDWKRDVLGLDVQSDAQPLSAGDAGGKGLVGHLRARFLAVTQALERLTALHRSLAREPLLLVTGTLPLEEATRRLVEAEAAQLSAVGTGRYDDAKRRDKARATGARRLAKAVRETLAALADNASKLGLAVCFAPARPWAALRALVKDNVLLHPVAFPLARRSGLVLLEQRASELVRETGPGDSRDPRGLVLAPLSGENRGWPLFLDAACLRALADNEGNTAGDACAVEDADGDACAVKEAGEDKATAAAGDNAPVQDTGDACVPDALSALRDLPADTPVTCDVGDTACTWSLEDALFLASVRAQGEGRERGKGGDPASLSPVPKFGTAFYETLLSPGEALVLLAHLACPDKGVRHALAVGCVARAFALAGRLRGMDVDPDLALAAGLVHDMAKNFHRHEATGAYFLEFLGLSSLARCVRDHRDLTLPADSPITERELVYLADKYCFGPSFVPVRTRFAQKAELFAGNACAQRAIRHRLEHALALEKRLGRELGMEPARIARGALEEQFGWGMDTTPGRHTDTTSGPASARTDGPDTRAG